MRLHRFYIQKEIVSGKQLVVESADLSNQLRKVFRLKPGDKIILFNGTGFDYVVNIANYNDSATMGTNNRIIFDVDPNPPASSRYLPLRQIYLYAALVKKDTFEWIVEKATELGATGVVPVMAERSEKKNLNDDRLKKISVEASEQSGRGDVPVIHPIVEFDGAIRDANESRIKNQESRIVAFHTEGEMFHKDLVGNNNEPIGVFIGPEGGWSEKEIEMFHKNNIQIRTLGTQVLRAETAVVAALSQVVFNV